MEYQIQPSPRMRTSKNVYESGVELDWTPGLTFDTPGDLNVVYSLSRGKSRLMGSLVFISFIIVADTFTHTTATGDLIITGLPFRATLGGLDPFVGPLDWEGITKAGYTDAVAIVNNEDKARIQMFGSGQSRTTVKAADVAGGAVRLGGSVWYFIDTTS